MNAETSSATFTEVACNKSGSASLCNDVVSPCQQQMKRRNDTDSEPHAESAPAMRPKKNCFNQERRFQAFDLMELSPIAEISMNLSDAVLDTPRGIFKAHAGGANEGTPLKSTSSHRIYRKEKTFNNLLSGDQEGAQSNLKSVAETPLNIHLEKKLCRNGYQGPHDSTSLRTSRRLNMDGSLNDMAMDDELCFYDDEQSFQQECSFSASPQLMGLLSPEGPAQHFQIVERPIGQTIQQKLQNDSGNSTARSSKTPAKSFRVFQSLSSESMESSIDDEYMELFEMESLEQQTGNAVFNFPSDLNSLIRGQIKNASPVISNALSNTPEMRRPSVRRCLSMNENQQQNPPKTPEFLKQVQETDTSTSNMLFSSRLVTGEHIKNAAITPVSSCFKRPEPPSTSSSPVQSKRYRGDGKENLDLLWKTRASAHNMGTSTCVVPLRKCMSMNDAEIMSALTRSESKNDLIGDFTKPFVLPLMEGRHRDLKSISSDTMARLMRGEYDEIVNSYTIIDCRYPYEYDGGHICGAKNLYTQEQIVEEFLTQQKTEQRQLRTDVNGNKRNIIIFHCEFSSERGPKLSRFLRNNDRARNTSSYPSLDYPEVYLLHNGYKEFYETHAELCVPVSYRPMLEPSYSEAYRHFRAKSKSWNGDGLVCGTSRHKKTRSRLML